MGNSLVPPIPTRKFSARAALVDLHENSTALLAECFRQFGIDSIAMSGEQAECLGKEKFEACVVRVGSKAAPVLHSARSSRSNNRMVIYGLGGTAKDALDLSQYGINAIFAEPLERQAAMKLVRSTQMLVMHELRRYARVPIVTQVSITAGAHKKFEASSVEISSGGMSLRSAQEVSAGTPLEVSFALLTLPRVWVRGNVTWAKASGKLFGVRFDPTDDRRKKVKEWVESYLGA
ncbi:MAG TPA: PilZ domain-containing protein [Terriglobales bacterium]|nr:PilZ domain-containing protein [Terriglobales bacterium]